MNAIQSLWFNEKPDGIDFRCGWLDVRFNFFSWALSSLFLKQHFNQVELVTDYVGAEFVEQISLPYTRVLTNLEVIKNNNYLWVSNKLYAYSIQQQPFIHVDTDAYLFERPDAELLRAPLFAQNFEYDHDDYINAYTDVTTYCAAIPKIIRKDSLSRLTAVNAGVIGGNNVLFFKELEGFVADFLQQNKATLASCRLDHLNVFVEQFFFKKYAEFKHIPVSYLSPIAFGPPPNYQMANFGQLPTNCPYVHVMNYKRNPTVCEQMAQRLWLESPELYEQVLTVCRELEATHHPISLPVAPQPTPFYRTDYILGLTQPLPLPNLLATDVATYIDALPQGQTKTVVEDVFQFESRRQAFIATLPDAATLRQHWQEYSRYTNKLLALPVEQYAQKQIRQGVYCSRIETEWNWAEANEFALQTADRDFAHNLQVEPSYYETVLCVYLHQGVVREQLLDAVNMLILDALEEPVSIASIIDSVCDQVLAYQSEINHQELADTVMSRIRHFLYHGVLEVVE